MAQQQQQVKPGDRLVAHGLKGRQDLNGQSGVLIGQGGKPDRVRVKFDSGEEVDLKQENLGIGAPGGGGAPPGGGGGGGGMPGMPGMPAGMPDPAQIQAMINQAVQQVRQMLESVGIRLPASTSPQQLAGGLVVAALAGLYLITRFFSMTVLMAVGGTAYWGLQIPGGQAILAQASAKVSSVVRRPIPRHALLMVLCLTVAILGQRLLGGGTSTGTTPANTGGSGRRDDPAIAQAIREAYDQGYEDGEKGADRRPPKHIPAPNLDDDPSAHGNEASGGAGQQKSGSGFGIQSILKYGMLAYFVFNLGKVPAGGFKTPIGCWDPQVAMANAKAQPLQCGGVLLMASGILF